MRGSPARRLLTPPALRRLRRCAPGWVFPGPGFTTGGLARNPRLPREGMSCGSSSCAFEGSDGTYGYRRVAAQLARWGIRAGLELVRALMRELGRGPCQPLPWRPATTRQGAAGPIPDLVARDFSADIPGAKMVGDITNIPTWEGWLYLATVIDCATRKVVGWAMDDNYRVPLITSAIRMAARNLSLPDGAVFHSDRGSNYTSAEFAAVLEQLGIRQSVGRTGVCPLTGQSLETRRSVTRRETLECLPAGDVGDTPVRHERR